MSDRLSVEFAPPLNGWLHVTLRSHDVELDDRVSYTPNDFLSELASALVAFLETRREGTARCSLEPDGYDILLEAGSSQFASGEGDPFAGPARRPAQGVIGGRSRSRGRRASCWSHILARLQKAREPLRPRFLGAQLPQWHRCSTRAAHGASDWWFAGVARTGIRAGVARVIRVRPAPP